MNEARSHPWTPLRLTAVISFLITIDRDTEPEVDMEAVRRFAGEVNDQNAKYGLHIESIKKVAQGYGLDCLVLEKRRLINLVGTSGHYHYRIEVAKSALEPFPYHPYED